MMVDPGQITYTAAVAFACERLTDAELAKLNLTVNFPGKDATQLSFFDEVSHLFTENHGTEMHEATKDALAVVVNRRLSGD